MWDKEGRKQLLCPYPPALWWSVPTSSLAVGSAAERFHGDVEQAQHSLMLLLES